MLSSIAIFILFVEYISLLEVNNSRIIAHLFNLNVLSVINFWLSLGYSLSKLSTLIQKSCFSRLASHLRLLPALIYMFLFFLFFIHCPFIFFCQHFTGLVSAETFDLIVTSLSFDSQEHLNVIISYFF